MLETNIHFIFFVLGLTKFLLGIILFQLSKIIENKIEGINYWMYGSFISAIGLLILSLFSYPIPLYAEFLFSIGLNLFILTGDILTLFGVLKFKNKPLNHKLWILPFLSLTGIIVFTFINYDIAIRFIIVSLNVTILYSFSAYEFFNFHKKGIKNYFRIAGILYIVFAFFNVVRIIKVMKNGISEPVPGDTISIFLALSVGIALNYLIFLFIIVISKTLNDDLNKEIGNKNKLYSVFSHELNSTVGNLVNYLYLFKSQKNKWDKSELENWTTKMESTSTNMRYLLENLLYWSKDQLNEIKVNLLNNNISNIIENVVQLLQNAASDKKIIITYNNPGSVYAYFDADLMEIVFRNLISNAIKYTESGGRIIISVAEKINTIEITVADNGIGIEQSRMEEIFDSISLNTTRGTNNEKGSGLGLSLCKEFVSLNKGILKAESVISKGSEFTVILQKK